MQFVPTHSHLPPPGLSGHSTAVKTRLHTHGVSVTCVVDLSTRTVSPFNPFTISQCHGAFHSISAHCQKKIEMTNFVYIL